RCGQIGVGADCGGFFGCGPIDLIESVGGIRRASLLCAGDGVPVIGILKRGILAVTFGSERIADGGFTLLFQIVSFQNAIGIGASGQFLNPLIQGIGGAEDGTKFIG